MMSFYVVVVMVVLMMMVSDENGWVSGVEGSRGVEMRPYGRTSDGRQVVLVALRRGRVRLALTNWGATITSLLLPNAQGTHYIHTYYYYHSSTHLYVKCSSFSSSSSSSSSSNTHYPITTLLLLLFTPVYESV